MEHAGAHDPLIGVTIGNYRVKVKLGAGGMGAVYMAEHPLIGKQVALKVLHAELSASKDVAARFFNEAKAVNDIKHPNIVDIIDFGWIPLQGRKAVYLLMEFLEGMSLAALLRRETALPWERASAIAWQIADALGASHAVGIIHRDLKPDNVMLVQRGQQRDFVKVLDFGIAKLTGAPDRSHQTRTGVILGTPAYMSPEQCEGRGNVDHRTDVYSLGIVLYKLLTGRVPFHGEGYGEVLMQHLTQAPAQPSSIRTGIQPHVEAVVMKALAKHRDARYPSMEEFMKALADPVGYVEGHGGLARFADALIPRCAAMPPASVITPEPTTLPETASVTPVSQQVDPTPSGKLQPLSTLRSSAGMIAAEARPRSSKARLIAAALVLLALTGGGILLTRQDGAQRAASATEAAAANDASGARLPAGDGGAVAPDHGTPPADPAQGSGDTADPGPTPPAPERVAIAIETRPTGAAVFMDGEAEPLGKTPLTIELAKSEEGVALTLRRRGYKDSVQRIIPREPGKFTWNLSRVQPEQRQQAQRQPAQRDGNESRRGVHQSVTLAPDLE